MSQQTPVARVIPRWVAWIERWPHPSDLASAPTSDVLRAWDRLGYPRRALRLKECARVLATEYGDTVPCDLDALLSLPGIGDYTARAILAFHFRQRVPVVDTNVRRVYSRACEGKFLPGPPRKTTLGEVEQLLPRDPERAAVVSTALMELGALVCTARLPECSRCPLTPRCEWIRRGRPEPTAAEQRDAQSRVQRFEGTDRQVRGRIMALARNHPVVDDVAVAGTSTDHAQANRALASLLADGLLVNAPDSGYTLPSD